MIQMSANCRMSMALAPLALCVSAGIAKPPAVLEHVPEGTTLFAVMPDVGSMLGDLSALNTALAGKLPPDAAGIGMGLFFAQSLVSQPGFDTNGSAAIMIELPEGGMDEQPSFTALLPISDLETFAKGPFMSGQGTKFDGGMATLDMDGESLHMKDIGDYTVASNDADSVSAFQAGEFMQAHAKALGGAGENALNGGDVVLVANLGKMGDMIDEMMAQAEQQVNFAAMMGGGEQVTEGFEMLKSAMKTVQEDGSVGLLALDASGEGLSFDAGVAFREGTESAAKFAEASDSGSLLAALPNDNFLFAYALDSQAEGLGDIMHMFADMTAKQDGMNANMAAMMKNSTGTSGMIGTTPAALGGAGLLSKQITYARSENPTKAVAAMRESLKAMDGQSMMGQKFTTSYEAGTAEVAGVEVDTYSVRSTADANGGGGGNPMAAMMDPAMINSMLFGMSGGPNGYIAAVDNGYYSTTSKNSELLSAALAAGQGENGLGKNAMLGKVASKLHDGRFGEGYFAIDQAFNTFGPFAQMMGMMDEFQPLEAMPPIGMSASGHGGGVIGRLHIPADVIGFLAEFAESMNAEDMMGDMMGGYEDDSQEPDF